MVTVRFFAGIREITGQKETTVAASTLKDLLTNLAAKHGLRFQHEVYGPEGVSDEAIILVNGRHLEHLPEGLETELVPDDTVAIFPLVGGG
ncbi:MAG TPA: MoaD/ThiS family protein [Firmicutes bacterium]|jgi:molybdopterin synthase sulfur carrier subunit|nr:MoaD/ThiS family protein [Bacillota bacterium]